MRRRAELLLLIVYLLCFQTRIGAQLLSSITDRPDDKDAITCVHASAAAQRSGQEITIAELVIEGDPHLPLAEQEQIVSSLKQQTYVGSPDEAVSEIAERARAAWQNRGYFKVTVNGDDTVLTSSPAAERIAVTLRIDEGQQYRLGEIRFVGNHVIADPTKLRSLFPLKRGEIFSRASIADGLENLRSAYSELGYLNFTSVPNAQIDEARQTISLHVEMDEGKQFRVSGIDVVGADTRLANELLMKRGDVYNQHFVDLFFQEYGDVIPPGRSPSSVTRLRLDERNGAVEITLDFRPCPDQS